MIRSAVNQGRYPADFQALREDASERSPSWLRDLRESGWAHFESLGFPTTRRGNERWKYTNVAPIAKTEFAYSFQSGTSVDIAALVPFRQHQSSSFDLVFVNGGLSLELSSTPPASGGLQISGIRDNDDADLLEHLGRYIQIENDGFAALNTAFVDDGAFVKVLDGYSESTQLRITYVTTNENETQPKVTHPRTLVLAGRNTHLTVIETYTGSPGDCYFTNAVTEIVLGEGARADHYRLLLESSGAFHVGTSRVTQGRDSEFSSASFAIGTSLARNDMEVLLNAPGGYCSLNGLYLTGDDQHIDNLISIDHALGGFDHGFRNLDLRILLPRTPGKQRHRTQDCDPILHGLNPTAGREGVSRW